MKQIKNKNAKSVPSTKFLTDLDYKYNIRERLARVNPVKAKNIKKAVQINTKRSKSTIYRVISAKHGEDISIDVNILIEFSKTFGCTVEDLINPAIL